MKSSNSGTESTREHSGADGFAGGLASVFVAISPITWVALMVVLLSLAAGIVLRAAWPTDDEDTVTVVHWTNGHLLRDDSGLRLLRSMAEEFNKAENRTADGKRIKIEIYYQGSSDLARDLLARVTTGRGIEKDMPDPTMVTPSTADLLVSVNYKAGRTVVDTTNIPNESIAKAYVGIVTYREMATCLGWPAKPIGYEDIIALGSNSDGWRKYPCAKSAWGPEPLVAFTDPLESDSGRGVLFTLYAIGAGRQPDELTLSDVHETNVINYVKSFQALVDHYMIGTIPLNTKIYQGQRFGHFFLMPEDNLIHLYEGTEDAVDRNGKEITAPPIKSDMVMIYPKEGSIARENCACIVQAPWVSAEQAEAASLWRTFLRKDEQQRSFMAAGFRPGTSLPVAEPIGPRYGLNPATPQVVINPELIDPAVSQEILNSWEDVKRPAIVSFVVDTSSSMKPKKLDLAKEGLVRALDSMSSNNKVGLITFSDTVQTRVAVADLELNRFELTERVEEMKPLGDTALFDAVKAGIAMADEAPGDPAAIRAVVVLTDGQATAGSVCLHQLIRMISAAERSIRHFCGGVNESTGVDDTGAHVDKASMSGMSLLVSTRHPVQVFFIGIGEDADIQIGRLLAEATGAEFQGVADEDLANFIEEFSKYF